MLVARMLLSLVDVIDALGIGSHLVNRPELILYNISVIIIESVLYINVKHNVVAWTTGQELTLRSLFFCDRDTNTSPWQSKYPPKLMNSLPCMSPTAQVGPSADVKESKQGTYSQGVKPRKSFELRTSFQESIGCKTQTDHTYALAV